MLAQNHQCFPGDHGEDDQDAEGEEGGEARGDVDQGGDALQGRQDHRGEEGRPSIQLFSTMVNFCSSFRRRTWECLSKR